VVASRPPATRCRGGDLVSIPFIAGQWSLPHLPGVGGGVVSRSQSPSLRGSGRFEAAYTASERDLVVSIPFIAGQWSLPPPAARRVGKEDKSQSPSLRGSGRFPWRARRRRSASRLNPLHCGAVVASFLPRPLLSACASLNPLHCGAVVASAMAPERAQRLEKSLNPLHCGAVVASRGAGRDLR